MQNNNPQSPRLIIHIPHSSLHIPFMDGYVENQELICKEMYKLTDWCTDLLFFSKDDIMLAPEFSRIFCDVERFADNSQEVMAQYGMGVLYEKTDTGEVLRTVTPELREKIMKFYYQKHHNKFTEAVRQQLEQHYLAVIIDCHSFPDIPLQRDFNQEPNRPDINIGTDPFHTPDKLLHLTREYFESAGYSVGINWPYSGTIVPAEYHRKEKNVHSIMIEVNRKLYLNETSDDLNENYYIIEDLTRDYLRRVKEYYGFIKMEQTLEKELSAEEKTHERMNPITFDNPKAQEALKKFKSDMETLMNRKPRKGENENKFLIEAMMKFIKNHNKKVEIIGSLHTAIKNKSIEDVKETLRLGASVNNHKFYRPEYIIKPVIKRLFRKTALDLALEVGNKQIIEYLLKQGAKPFYREELYDMYMDTQRNLTEQEILEMACLSSKGTGINQVIIWVGPNPYGDEIRIKVNNVPDNLKNFDLFDIILPDYKISGEVNTNFITGEILQEIIQFIELNKEIIISFSNYEIDTIELFRNLKKVRKI